jgi:hypothetical protein
LKKRWQVLPSVQLLSRISCGTFIALANWDKILSTPICFPRRAWMILVTQDTKMWRNMWLRWNKPSMLG